MKFQFNSDRLIRQIDWLLIISIIGLLILGALVIRSATFQDQKSENGLADVFQKQLVWIIVGIIALTLIWILDYHLLKGYYLHFYIFNLILLFVVLFLGNREPGAQRWIQIGSFHLQPSEFAKLIIIITLASFLSFRRGEIDKAKDIAMSFGHIALPSLFIFLQPDLGTSLVLLAILIGQLFISGIRLKQLGLILAIGVFIVFIILQFNLLQDYQMNRLLTFINPELDPQGAGYNLTQSKIAIGSGQIFGKGLFSGTQTNLRFLPARHTDFIFSVVGEELGFIGTTLVLVLYLIIITRGIAAAINSKDIYGALIAIGIVSMWVFQITVNVGMTIGIMPITGIPLPFLSYGGSSLLINMLSVGLLLNIYSRRFKTSKKIITV